MAHQIHAAMLQGHKAAYKKINPVYVASTELLGVTKSAIRVIPQATNKGINLQLLLHEEKSKVPALLWQEFIWARR